MPLLRARRAGHDRRDRAASTSPCATTGSSTTSRAAGRAGLTIVAYGGDGRRRPDCAARRTPRGGVRRRATPRPTTWRCWPSPPAPPAGPRRPCTSTATCSPNADTFSPARAAARRRTTSSPARRRSRSPSGSAGCVVFPLRVGAVDAAASRRRRPPSWPSSIARPRRHRAASPRRPPTGRCSPAGRSARCRACAAACPPGSTCPAPTWQAFHEATGVASSTASARPRCCTSSSPRPTTTSGPARPVGRCPASAPPSSTPTGNPVPAGQPGRLAVKGPTGCRYLADDRAGGLRAERLEHHRRHVRPRRGRLLLVPGAQRRHDHLLRLQHRRARGRGGAARPPRRRRVRRRRRARRGARHRSSRPFVVLRDGVAARRRRRPRSCRTSSSSTIAPYKYPRAVEFVDELPRTATGKLQRFRLRRPREREQAPPVGGRTRRAAGRACGNVLWPAKMTSPLVR